MGLLTALPTLPKPVWEFGSYHVVGQEHRGTVKDAVHSEVVGCDLRMGPGVDRIEDLHALSIADDSIGTALLLDTVEHVARPWRALEEVHRVLRPGGIVLMTSHMYFPIHAHPDDYWRFTKSGFRVLLEPFEVICVESAGMAKLPHTVVGVAGKAPVDPALKIALERVVRDWVRTNANSWKESILAALPPVLLVPAYDGFMRLLQRRKR